RNNYFNLVSCNEPEAVPQIDKASNLISVFPNPATNNISIEINDQTGDVLIYLTDLSGRVLWQQNMQGISAHATFNIDLSTYPAGVYFVKTISNGGRGAAQVQLVK